MPKKTNKTSHVLNLITNGTEPEEPVSKMPAAGAKTVVVVDDEDEQISNKILDDLTNQLEEEEFAAEPAQEPEAAPEPEETQEPDAMPEPEETQEPEAVSEPEEAQEPEAVSEPEEAQEPEAMPEAEEDDEDGCHIVNVMENIISRMDLEVHMKQNDVCTCSRCRADVKALILTRLPAKYVVAHVGSVAPLIGYYENKFKVRIFTEVLKSCAMVKENPRHKR